ncbi:MAG: RidA family protein [Albidovulum sp.]|nr:RidA family protein [Albidovulum sp.]MDE0307177.1 RidA family protein [Albidovulum sp.]MDE0531905.1 RidA family protein [Albidovulum sp.]
MGQIDSKLEELGIELPQPLILPSANRTSAVQAGSMLYLSGHGAALLEDGSVRRRGKVGLEITEEEAYSTARAVAIKMIATLKHALGDLDRVQKVVKILGMINSHPDFERQNIVLNGASDLFFEVFGPEIGCHARSSVGVDGLVDRQPVEIEGVFLVRD